MDWKDIVQEVNPLWVPPSTSGDRVNAKSLQPSDNTAKQSAPPSGRTRTKAKMRSPRRAAEWEWRVRYRRASWQQAQVRYFQRRFAALRLRDKLLLAGPYSAIVELSVQRRWVGPWETDTEDTR